MFIYGDLIIDLFSILELHVNKFFFFIGGLLIFIQMKCNFYNF